MLPASLGGSARAPPSGAFLRPATATAGPTPPPYKLLNYTQRVDHTNFFHSGTFVQRYLVVDAWFARGGPILFFTGAEGGDIEALYAYGDYGTPMALAEKLRGLVVFAECRFFGASLPFGNASFEPTADRVGLLSVEQILADYGVLIGSLRDDYGWEAPLVTFGGSLAGALAL